MKGKDCLSLDDLTIIIPARNAASTLAVALERLREGRESAGPRVIVVDDGSTDGTVCLVQSSNNRFGGIGLISTQHVGPSAARNIGLETSQTDLVAFLDADDVPHIAAYLSMVEIAVHTGADLIQGMQGKWEVLGEAPPRQADLQAVRLAPKRLVLDGWGGTLCSVYRRSFLMRHQLHYPRDVAFGEDLVFALDVAMSEPKVVRTNQVVYTYRRGLDDQATASTSKRWLTLTEALRVSELHAAEQSLRWRRLVFGLIWWYAYRGLPHVDEALRKDAAQRLRLFAQGSAGRLDLGPLDASIGRTEVLASKVYRRIKLSVGLGQWSAGLGQWSAGPGS